MCLPVHNGVYLTIGTVLATVQYTHQDATIPPKELKSDSQDRSYISPAGINCTGCDVGEFVETHCNEAMGKSQCKPCPGGTFSTTPGGATSCQPCKFCSRGVDVISGCTATSDRVCACPKGTKPNIIDGLILNCKPVEALLPSTTEYETTTKHSVSSSQEYQSRTITHIPASNGYETNATGSDVNTILLWGIGGFFLAVALIIIVIIVILCCLRKNKKGSYTFVTQ